MKNIQEKRFKKMLIVGNMSSGKSTFINSILRENILPTSNQACTAKEIKIKISNKKKYFSYSLNQRSRSLKKDGREKVSFLNNSYNINKIEIKGPSIFTRLEGYEIYDSPGPNNSIDEEHKNITLSMLNKGEFEKVIFVFNAGNLFTTDDKILLESLLKEKYGIEKKLTIVVNKIDKIHITEENTDDEIIKKVEEFLEKFGMKNYNIFLYSSIYFYLKKESEKTKSEKRLLKLLEETYEKNGIKKLKEIRKKIFRREEIDERRKDTRDFKRNKV